MGRNLDTYIQAYTSLWNEWRNKYPIVQYKISHRNNACNTKLHSWKIQMTLNEISVQMKKTCDTAFTK